MIASSDLLLLLIDLYVVHLNLLFFFLMIRRPPRSTPLSLHDALPIWSGCSGSRMSNGARRSSAATRSAARSTSSRRGSRRPPDRKSTRLNSSHGYISYAVFCLKKKKIIKILIKHMKYTVKDQC